MLSANANFAKSTAWWRLELRRLNRALRLGLRAFGTSLLRKIVQSPARGPAHGTFSDYEKVRAGEIPGRVILEFQPDPILPEPSIMLLCRRAQHLQQPW